MFQNINNVLINIPLHLKMCLLNEMMKHNALECESFIIKYIMHKGILRCDAY
jgi:hypothetical protein